MKRFIPYLTLLKPVRLQFVLAVLTGLIAAAASGFGLPFMMDRVFPLIFRNQDTDMYAATPDWLLDICDWFGAEEPSVAMVTIAACAMLPLVFLVRGVFGYLNTYLINLVGLHVLEDLRLKAFDRLQRLPLAFHTKHKEGDLLSRIMTDSSLMQVVLVRVASDLIIQPGTLMAALGFLVYKSFESNHVFFVLAAMLSVPVCVFPIRALGGKLVKKARQLQAQAGDMTATVGENLASQQEIRAYNMEDSQVERFGRETSLFRKLQLKVVKYRYLVSPSVEIIAAAGISGAIYYGVQNGLTLQEFIPLVGAMYFAYEPIKKLGAVSASLKQGEASLERIEHILHAEDKMQDPEKGVKFDSVRGEVTFAGVDFSYDKDPILNGVDLTVPAGQVVALVGPSGAGKSTFVNLIPRFYEAVKGEVLIDGVNVKEVKKYDLRDQIALVSQQPLLFRGTIAENILIGKPGATREQVEESARRANAHDFITSLPEGYETLLGERGEGLSGGQRQRVAIARAFLKDAPILILDEATSALDAESEAKIQAGLERLASGRTTFIIAHRFSSIRHADRILVFEKGLVGGGKIIADGSHEELFESSTLYRELYTRQQMD